MQKTWRAFWRIVAVVIVVFLALLVARSDIPRLFKPLHIHMPGTQIGDVAPFDSVQSCKPCHQTIYREWQGSMHGNATRDPLYWALLHATTKYDILRGDWCARCHGPVSWLEGRAHPNGEEYGRKDFFETNCDFCHRMVDSVNPDSTALYCMQLGPPRDYGNAQYVVQTYPDKKRGPRGERPQAHSVMRDEFQRRSSMCGVCHDQSNPYAADPMVHNVTAAPHTYGAHQRTYSEWLLSWYATQGEAGTCQGCHMSRTPGYSAEVGGRFRLDVARHDLTGGNLFTPAILPYFLDIWPDIDTAALREGMERSRTLMSKAARLEVAAGRVRDSVVALVRVTNLTGHKLPGGVSARKMWIQLIGVSANGDTIVRSGRYDYEAAELVADPQLKLYQKILGMTEQSAAIFGFGTVAGPSPYAAWNDTVYFDNRIPPRGFSLAAFRERMAQPVGYHYDDGQYWDVTRYVLPREVVTVIVSLMYQTITKSAIEFLRQENIGNEFDERNFGQRLYDAWAAAGKGAPLIMNTASAQVGNAPPSLDPVRDTPLPVEFRLAQNYPNPFNATTTIEFWVSADADVSLEMYDMLGRKCATLVRERMQGSRSVTIDASQFASGIYLYSLSVNDRRETKKFVLIK